MYPFKVVSSGFALLSILSRTSAETNGQLCVEGPFEKTPTFGNPTFVPNEYIWCDTKWDKGAVVTGIELWASSRMIKALQISYSDGTKGPIHGDAEKTDDKNGNWYSHESISWKQSEPIKSISLGQTSWESFAKSVGIFRMKVGEQSISVKSDVGDDNGSPVLVHSGILLGAAGCSWLDRVECLRLMFLSSTVGKAEIVEIKFPQSLEELNKKQQGVEQISLKTAQYKNSGKEGSGNQSFVFESTSTQEIVTSLQQVDSKTFNTEVSVSASANVGVPLFGASVETTASTGFEEEHVTATGESKKTADSLKFGQSGTLPPGKGAECTATAQRGTFESDYTSKVRITLDGGQKFFLEQPGHFKSVGFSDALVDCKVVDLKDLDPKVATKEVAKVVKRGIGFKA